MFIRLSKMVSVCLILADNYCHNLVCEDCISKCIIKVCAGNMLVFFGTKLLEHLKA